MDWRNMAAVLLGLLAGVGAVPLVFAQAGPPISVDQETFSFELSGHRIAIPHPAWTASTNETGSVFGENRIFHRQVADGVELLEFIPSAENFDDWTHMSAVLAVGQPGYKIEHHEVGIIAAFQDGCLPDSLLAQRIPPIETATVPAILIACGAYAQDGVGRVSGGGEILIAVMLETPQGAVKAYEEWRGPAFDPNKPETWPLSELEVLFRISLMQRYVRFEPLDDEE